MIYLNKIREYYEVILLVIMMIASGSPLQTQYNSLVTIVYLIGAVMYVVLFAAHRINRMVFTQIGVLGALLLLTVFSNVDKDIGHYLGVFSMIAATGCVISIMPFERFRSLLIDMITIVSIYSVIITFFSNFFPDYPGTLPAIEVGTLKWRHIGFIYYYWGWHPWMSFIRNSACFREPGVWGCYSVLALAMLIASTREYSKSDVKKAIIIIIGIISSVSTTAVFGLILCCFLYFSQTHKITIRRLRVLMCTIIIFVLIINKFGNRLFGKLSSSSSSYNSLTERMDGMNGGIAYFLDHPLFGSGYTTYLSDTKGTSANSYIDILGKYGLIFSAVVVFGLVLFVLYGKYKTISRFVMCLIFLVTLGTQNLILYPLFLGLSFYGYKMNSIYKRGMLYE